VGEEGIGTCKGLLWKEFRTLRNVLENTKLASADGGKEELHWGKGGEGGNVFLTIQFGKKEWGAAIWG